MQQYEDDATILEGAVLLRRIPPWHFFFDKNLRRVRPSGAAFEDDPDGTPMSVSLKEVMERDGRTVSDSLARHPGFALVGFTARLARKCEQGIARDPLPDDTAHAVVFGPKPKSVRRKFAREAVWMVAPPASQVRLD